LAIGFFCRRLLTSGFGIATDNRTVAFRTQYVGHYQAAGVPVPTGAKSTYLSEEIVKYLCSIDGAVEVTNCLGFYPRLTVRRKNE